MKKGDDSYVLFVGTYPPRECGIATFTRDLTNSIDKAGFPEIRTKILAMNKDGVESYKYPKKVIYQINDCRVDDYIKTAKKINKNHSIKLICIQHEFGIFGGNEGDNLLVFLEIIEKPVIITFHSILPNPDNELKSVVRAIAEKCHGIIVMTETGLEILRRDYNIKTNIYVIPHGIPIVDFENQRKEKKRLGYEDKIVLSSFGLVGPGKGYETMIEALPEVIEKYPNVVYLIIGETHPSVREEDGEGYRNMLKEIVEHHNIQEHVKFYNKYHDLQEIVQFLKATDIYISSSDNPNQITSGTLSYAAGCGRAIISTPFLHAKDFCKNDRGVLANFSDPKSFATKVIELLGDTEKRKKIEKESYYYTRHMTWPNVALSYNKTFSQHLKLSELPEIKNLPKINTSHLLRMTDNFGIIQFAKQSFPEISSGYTLDDNARAMLVCTMHYKIFKEYKHLCLLKTYLDYVKYVQDKDGRLYNYVNGATRKVDYEKWSEDAHGRALWALGFLASSEELPEDLKREAERVFLKAFAVADFHSPRALAFTIIGLYYFNKNKKSSQIIKNIRVLSDRILDLYGKNSKPDWKWFEDNLTYANSKLPESMMYAYLTTKRKRFLSVALESLDFLISKTFTDNVFSPVGQRGWYEMGKEKSLFDQQPIEAAYTVQTLVLAHSVTKEEKFRKLFMNAFLWFLGKNSLNQVIYNEKTGGCHDGIGEHSINLNQGAESTLSYLIARLSLAGF